MLSLLVSQDANKRRQGRIALSTSRMVGDFDGENQPPLDSFYRVSLKDLSTRGVSFISPMQPRFDRIILQLGKDGLSLEAKVVRVHDLGSGQFEVGCEFVSPLT